MAQLDDNTRFCAYMGMLVIFFFGYLAGSFLESWRSLLRSEHFTKETLDVIEVSGHMYYLNGYLDGRKGEPIKIHPKKAKDEADTKLAHERNK